MRVLEARQVAMRNQLLLIDMLSHSIAQARKDHLDFWNKEEPLARLNLAIERLERARATVRRIAALERKIIEEFYAQREAEKARFRYTAKAEKMLEEVKTLQGLPSPEFQAAFAKELGKSLSPQDRAMMEAYQNELRKK